MHKSNKVVTTTMLSRFQDALTLLCGERPSESLCREWMQDLNDDLQGWVLHHISPLTPWASEKSRSVEPPTSSARAKVLRNAASRRAARGRLMRSARSAG